ncbi:MAG: dTDP-4-dehydrorhamnose 3,5-epimerase family protein [Halomonas venusta]|nr:dTDP-4-dehydrorhamnose 3,5-epimerase family protein [Halomonas venusta]
MKATRLAIPDVILFEPKVFGDERDFFYASFSKLRFEEMVGRPVQFVHENYSRSVKGVLRGVHYQIKKLQDKLVRVVHGEVFDVAVYIRKSSATFVQWIGAHLSAKNKHQLWVSIGYRIDNVVLFNKKYLA